MCCDLLWIFSLIFCSVRVKMTKNLLIVSILSCSIAIAVSTTSCIGKCPKINPNDDVYLLPHEDCNKFCSCNYGIAYVQRCPANLHYSPKERVCAFPEDVKCKGIIGNNVGSSDPNYGAGGASIADFIPINDQCIGNCSPNSFNGTIETLPNRNCRKFCRCINGIAESRYCPGDLHFSPKLGVCTYPQIAECQMMTTTTEKSVPNGECCRCPNSVTGDENIHLTTRYPWNTPGYGYCIGKCPATDNYLVHLPHKYCNKFCKCDRGYPVEFSCPSGLHFNPFLNVCDYPSNANCQGIKS